MKKISMLTFVCIMTLVLSLSLYSCGGGDAGDKTGGNTGGTSSGEGNSTSNTGTGNNSGDSNVEGGSSTEITKQKIDVTKITHSTPFSEGKAFVNLNRDYSKNYCIDTEGNILFTVESPTGLTTSSFYNGLATVSDGILCDEQGKIIKAEDFGGTKFLINYTSGANSDYRFKMFMDGYIFVRKTTTNYTGSVDEVGIINSELELIVDFSEELNELYEKYDDNRAKYYDGYLFYYDDRYNSDLGKRVYDWYILNLNTGEESYDINAAFAKMNIKHPSDIWNCFERVYHDIRDPERTPIIDMTGYDRVNCGQFENGTAPLIFVVDGANDHKEYFTILKEDGSFAFEPIELTGHGGRAYASNGKYVVTTTEGSRVKVIMTSFDINGKVAEKTHQPTGYFYFDEFENDVILIFDGRYYYYTFELNILLQ